MKLLRSESWNSSLPRLYFQRHWLVVKKTFATTGEIMGVHCSVAAAFPRLTKASRLGAISHRPHQMAGGTLFLYWYAVPPCTGGVSTSTPVVPSRSSPVGIGNRLPAERVCETVSLAGFRTRADPWSVKREWHTLLKSRGVDSRGSRGWTTTYTLNWNRLVKLQVEKVTFSDFIVMASEGDWKMLFSVLLARCEMGM